MISADARKTRPSVDTVGRDAIIRLRSAGVAQLVERNLAKVEVESSRLFSRSRIPGESEAFPLLVPANACSAVQVLASPGTLRVLLQCSAHTAARWQSGYAAACKAVYLGSIPGRASKVSSTSPGLARMVKLVDTRDLKSLAPNRAYRFDSGSGHHALPITVSRP